MRNVLLLILALGLPSGALADNDPFARARADISTFCKGGRSCIAKQRDELGHFVTMMAAFSDPGHANARRCMIAGKRGRHIDWTVATPCLRAAVRGRQIGR